MKAIRWMLLAGLLLFPLPTVVAEPGVEYTRPDTEGHYDFDDLQPGEKLHTVYMSPRSATSVLTLVAPGGKPVESVLFDESKHNENTESICAPNMLTVPPSGVRIDFPIPVKRLSVYVVADNIDNERRCMVSVYNADGERLGGDLATHPFGPVPDAGNKPEGMDPRTTDMQYMVWSMPPPLPPPYSNPLHGQPATYLIFHPDGEGVRIGRVQSVTTEFGE